MSPTKPGYKVTKTVSLPIDLLNEVAGLAESRGTTLNRVIEELLRKGLEAIE